MRGRGPVEVPAAFDRPDFDHPDLVQMAPRSERASERERERDREIERSSDFDHPGFDHPGAAAPPDRLPLTASSTRISHNVSIEWF